MGDNELPSGRRSLPYRLLEMLPGTLSLGLPVVLVAVSLVDPLLGARLVMLLIVLALLRGALGSIDAVRGYRRLRQAEAVDWGAMSSELEAVLRAVRGLPAVAVRAPAPAMPARLRRAHRRLLAEAARRPEGRPLPSEVVHAVIVTACNEPYDVVERSMQALAAAAIGSERLVVVLAYEERGGDAMRRTAARLELEYGYLFRAFEAVEHPAGLPDEIPGKGANLTHAGRHLERWLEVNGIDPARVVVTSLDCDNRPHPRYFDAVSYEFVRADDRDRVSFQPVSLFLGNVWHAAAPMRVIAAGNSIWNLISTVRPRALRNFASHSQPMPALIGMGFWSRRTIVEDGHQYWRSYFHFRGRYRVVPVRLPVYQDVVLAETLGRSLRTQFRQLARWAYGASDVPYVGVRLLPGRRPAPFWRTAPRFARLLESHVTLASVAPLIAFGPWIPVLASEGLRWLREALPAEGWGAGVPHGMAARAGFDEFVRSLPGLVELVQRAALPALLTMLLVSLLLLPSRPAGLRRIRWIGMVVQWALLPLTALLYNALAAVRSQWLLVIGAYRERFDVTEKAMPGASREGRLPSR